MPCNDGGYPGEGMYNDEHIKTLKRELGDIEAMLCGISTAIESLGKKSQEIFLNKVDWEEVGLSKKDYYDWWTEHKLEDKERKENV